MLACSVTFVLVLKMFIQVSVHNADMWNHTSIDVSLRTILLYKDIDLIKKDSDVRKEMIKNTFHNSESKPGATEEDGGSYQLGLLKRGVKRSVYLPVNQLLNPLTWPTSC